VTEIFKFIGPRSRRPGATNRLQAASFLTGGGSAFEA